VVPLVKGGPHFGASPEDDAIVEEMIAEQRIDDRELALARAGCAILDAAAPGTHAPGTQPPGTQPPGTHAPSPQAPGTQAPDNRHPSPSDREEALKGWCAARVRDRAYRHWVIFRFPETLDYWHLVDTQPAAGIPGVIGPDWRLRPRDGFRLTDARMRLRDVLSEIHYCVLCHERDKDSCSKGLHDKNGSVAGNPLGIELARCPLGEKISEMHMLRKMGDAVGALALVTLDNPMCPGTGHRICNDCMKSCIYQKQEPVNIPQIETGVLTDVLDMPWGVEIYQLLTRWN